MHTGAFVAKISYRIYSDENKNHINIITDRSDLLLMQHERASWGA